MQEITTQLTTMEKKLVNALRAKYPSLSETELLVEAMLSTGRSLSNIAVVFGCGVDSIQNQEHTIAKKLDRTRKSASGQQSADSIRQSSSRTERVRQQQPGWLIPGVWWMEETENTVFI